MAAEPSERAVVSGSPRALLWLALGAAAGVACAAVGLLLSGERDRALPANAAASVNGTVIRLEEYDRAVAAFASDRREPITDADRRHVLDRMLDEELLVQRGLELGLARHDRRVRGDIVSAVIDLIVSQADVGDPGDDEVRAFYDENREYFARTERLLVQQVFVRAAPLRSEDEARARAGQAVARLRGGESFDSVKQSLGDSEVAPVPRDLLPIAKLQEYLGPTAAHAAQALEVGATSEPQRSASGYHVLVLLDRTPGEAPALADVSEEVRAELHRRASERALRSYLDDLRASADVRVRQGREAAAQRGEAERSVGPRGGGP
jgi:PPIC-type PPIASE domain